MSSSKKDYKKLYQLQDKFLSWWGTLGLPFYLTGGTALGRFYLGHRFSEDLDFFINASPHFKNYISILQRNIGSQFNINQQESLFTEDYARFFISGDNVFLKIELVNDVEIYLGNSLNHSFGLIDNPRNILSNKLTAIVGRDEPKDIFDIVSIALNYSFNWQDIFAGAKLKSVINEIDIEQRLCSFPLEWLENVDWIMHPIDYRFFATTLKTIADDFLLGSINSIGLKKNVIDKATIIHS